MNNFHKSVLLKEAVDLLQVNKGNTYIDATLGGGGHAIEIIKRGGIVLGIDQDKEAIDFVKTNFQSEVEDGKLILSKGNFRNIREIAKDKGFEKVSGIIFDLGVSSHQIDSKERGFSFLRNGPLDMRMDKDLQVSAEHIVNLLGRDDLYKLFKNLGEEHNAKAIASSIIGRRKMKAIKTTNELVQAIGEAYGIKGEISDFDKNRISQKVFQALRIEVNAEIESLKEGLIEGFSLLNNKGILSVISFHSLEDKIVKEYFESMKANNFGNILTEKPIIASDTETSENRRSKSAKLRALQKIN